ncbi:ABC transporter ATP-binding protein [Hansschlegelia plantiphila]|uniref:Nitrate/sulfonate/bicarbonate ABC transporter ATP-binding protein n=1 Tax=Hansschlegelia plantiphila TaxID=374655 RepID=A0A9W6J5G8_9HYPH|nr:ABC transporter ATP-binding protein [Hansschlegelia plantiphila]GLK69749.1 nitrate/sulfonate/bicarbonate ABC transporter ATP-binding protein [Hansschlegelia plantiphila]
MLTLKQVSKTFGAGQQALSNVSLSVSEGRILAIVGGSGCGKSTLLRAIAGLDSPTSGEALLDGSRIIGPREEIGLVFQEPRLLPWLTVRGNVGFGLEGRPDAERRALVDEALERVGLLDKAEVWPRQLSGGQAQRAALARALVVRPKVLLLDEPFSALDAITRADLQDHLLELWAAFRATLVLVTHDVEEAVLLADEIVVMSSRPGRVFEQVAVDLPRPRERRSAALEAVARSVAASLDRAIDRNAVRRSLPKPAAA